ncbi:ion channel protein [Streptomyces sp. RLB3-17]|uniref:ion channel protein n=1 Tax=Streptomyces TaxID=1883 RepID=UPI0011644DBC|nr:MULTISPECIES: ion channel protein [unclassified Streptomyces]QDN99882.1 ion channel protein [Streptomyces sp. RLB1-9]QDO21613.1 ion channel protein [Streptomyces sp. S1A1-8]QDO31737.1 ion channel protein [Streptomyces sp. S1A1-3]QDO41658.1 ion channel protein [Streptomyces sp. RLB3-17]
MSTDASTATPLRRLLPLIVPSVVVGVAAALVLLGVSLLADRFKDVLWETLPDALGVGRYSVVWMVVMLTATGIAVGLVVWKVPGHAGPDPATTGLVDAPLPPRVLPGLLVATVLTLAGGVSLGPENPITAVNVALAYWLGTRVIPGSAVGLWVGLAVAGTIGALFGTPVAAALIFSEVLAGQPGPGALWDRLLPPLLAGGTGALTMMLLEHPSFDLALPAYEGPHWGDLLSALVVASLAAAIGMTAVCALPYAHGAFSRLRHPMVALPVGGLVLGLLGALGGPLTLFKGLDEVKTLAANPEGWSAGRFALMFAVKLAALLVATSCGFRGGRIFPSVFAGVALGLCAHALVPQVNPTLAVVCAVLGVLLAVTRQGWISLFTAAVLVAQPAVLPLLVLASVPAWLIVTGRPQMQLRADGSAIR